MLIVNSFKVLEQSLSKLPFDKSKYVFRKRDLFQAYFVYSNYLEDISPPTPFRFFPFKMDEWVVLGICVNLDKKRRGNGVFFYVGYANPIVAERNLRLLLGELGGIST